MEEEEVIEPDDGVGEVHQLHKVRGDDVHTVHAWFLCLHPRHDDWQVPAGDRKQTSSAVGFNLQVLYLYTLNHSRKKVHILEMRSEKHFLKCLWSLF